MWISFLDTPDHSSISLSCRANLFPSLAAKQELLVVKKTAEDRWATRDSTLLMGNQGKLDDMKVTSAAASAAATASAS